MVINYIFSAYFLCIIYIYKSRLYIRTFPKPYKINFIKLMYTITADDKNFNTQSKPFFLLQSEGQH